MATSPSRRASLTNDAVEEAVRNLFLGGHQLRDEDRKKAIEVRGLLQELARANRSSGRSWVDAAAGKAPVGLLAAHFFGLRHLVVIERSPDRIAACLRAASRIGPACRVDVSATDVADPAGWPGEPQVVVGLHACGGASDAIIERAISAAATWVFLVPCCHASPAFAVEAAARAGIPKQAEVRRKFVEACVDAERVLRLEASGYEVTTLAFVPATVTPRNLLIRARRLGGALATSTTPRSRAAAESLAKLRGGACPDALVSPEDARPTAR